MGKRIVQIEIAVLSLLVMVEALYWPIIRKAGTPLEWWQNLYLAKIGGFVGFPAWVVLLKSPFEGTLQLIFAWVLMIAWASFLYRLSGVVIRFIQKLRQQEF
jgi:hypothetical protein